MRRSRKMRNDNRDINNLMRMFNDELTEEEERKIEELDRIRDTKKKSSNPYCACGGDIEGEETLSLDTH
jgi:hypothetical protein